MRAFVSIAAVILMVGSATASAQPAYYPSGPQRDVLVETVNEGGWTFCFGSRYPGEFDLSLILDCQGEYMLLVCYPADLPVEDPEFTLLAAAPRSDVLADTGQNPGVTTSSNGSEWYFSEAQGSMGFAMGGDSVVKAECDTNETNGDYRLCWHLDDDLITAGYRCGSVEGAPGDLTEDNGWVRAVYVADTPVPSVSRWHLLALGLLLIAAALVSRRMWARGS